jgi:hypothetical protein
MGEEDDKQAADLLTSELISANHAEFHERVGSVLALCRDGRICPEEAIRQIGSIHEEVAKANHKLRSKRP